MCVISGGEGPFAAAHAGDGLGVWVDGIGNLGAAGVSLKAKRGDMHGAGHEFIHGATLVKVGVNNQT